jgi:hypothetical protein
MQKGKTPEAHPEYAGGSNGRSVISQDETAIATAILYFRADTISMGHIGVVL